MIKADITDVTASFIQYLEKADSSFECDESVKRFIEKLEAWERLKEEAKFEFKGVELDKMRVKIWLDHPYEDFMDDLLLIFGGEDE